MRCSDWQWEIGEVLGFVSLESWADALLEADPDCNVPAFAIIAMYPPSAISSTGRQVEVGGIHSVPISAPSTLTFVPLQNITGLIGYFDITTTPDGKVESKRFILERRFGHNFFGDSIPIFFDQ